MGVSPFLEKAVQPIDYPESDGSPVSDNTTQVRWMVTLHGNLAAWHPCRSRFLPVFLPGGADRV